MITCYLTRRRLINLLGAKAAGLATHLSGMGLRGRMPRRRVDVYRPTPSTGAACRLNLHRSTTTMHMGRNRSIADQACGGRSCHCTPSSSRRAVRGNTSCICSITSCSMQLLERVRVKPRYDEVEQARKTVLNELQRRRCKHSSPVPYWRDAGASYDR